MEWLAQETADLARLVEEIPGLADLDDPWTRDGLNLIDAAARAAFPDPDADLDRDEQAAFARMARGLGHIVLLTLGVGKWVWVNNTVLEIAPLGPAVELPKAPAWVDPDAMLRAALARPENLVRMLDNAIEAYHRWISGGFADS